MFSYLFSHMFPICFPYFLISSHIDLCLPTFFPIWFSYVPYVSHMFPIFPDSPQGFPTCLPSVLPHSSHMVPTCTLFFYISPNFPHQIFPGCVTYVFPLFPFFFVILLKFCPIPICFATFLPMFPTFFPSFNIFLQFFPYVSHMFPACFPDICYPTVFPTDFLSFPYSAPVFPIFSRFTAIFPTFFRGTDRAPLMVNIASTVAAACRARSSVRPKASKARPRRMGRVGDVKKKNPGEKNSKMITWIYFRK